MSQVVDHGRLLATAQRYLEVGQPERTLEALAGLDPEIASSGEASWLRSAAHLDLEDYAAAAEAARYGLADSPHDTGLLSLLCVAEMQRENLAAAEEAILAALAIESSHPELLAQYADVLLRAGQLDKAERILGHASNSDPDSTRVLRTRIMLAHLRHDDRQAEELARELLARDPGSSAGQQLLGALESGRGDAKSASQRFAEVVRADPDDHRSAASARTLRRMSHPLWWPNRLFARYGAGPTWVAAMGTIFGLRALGLSTVAGIAALAWFVVCIWSWIGVAVLRER